MTDSANTVFFSNSQSRVKGALHFFDADHRFGTMATITHILSQGLLAYGRHVRGQTDVNTDSSERSWIGTISSSVNIANSSWALFSKQGGTPPEGNNVIERMFNAAKHPQESTVYAIPAYQFPTSVAQRIDDIQAGARAYGGKYAQGHTLEYEKARLGKGVLGMMTLGMITYGAFGKSAEQQKHEMHAAVDRYVLDKQLPVHFSKSESKPQNLFGRLSEVMQFAIATDKVGMAGRAINLAQAAFQVQEGVRKNASHLNHKDGLPLLLSGILQFVSVVCYIPYLYEGRLREAEKKLGHAPLKISSQNAQGASVYL